MKAVQNNAVLEMDLITLRQIIGKSRVCMLGTYHNHEMNFNPMSHVDIDEFGNLWFFITLISNTAADLVKNSSVILTYTNEPERVFITVKGTAMLENNKVKMKELFTSYLNAWFPGGIKDPSISLLVVQPEELEFWSVNEIKASMPKKYMGQSLRIGLWR